MRTAAPPLLPILKSRLVGELLALLSMDPSRGWTASELSERTGAAYTTVARELRELARSELVDGEHVGRTRVVRAKTTGPYAAPLAALTIAAFGPRQILGEELDQVAGIEHAWIIGSWAARFAGQQGPPPNDIDVLVLGRPDRDALHDAARAAERRLGVPVNTTIRSPEQWASADDGFARQVKSSPMVSVFDDTPDS